VPRQLELTRREIDVVVGLLCDAKGRWLITSRPAGKELAGWWEFPGGKRSAGEEPFAALVRELDEELGVHVEAAERWLELVHDYPDRRVHLDVWLVTRYRGTPAPRESQQVRWLRAHELEAAGLLPADRPIVERLDALER
jgi:8-oxo-dGTP diphosphatase